MIKSAQAGESATAEKPAKKVSLASIPCRPPLQRKERFSTHEYAPYKKRGKATLTGSVCKNLPDGVPCPEKIVVFANPVTSYSTEWWNLHWVDGHTISAVDKRTREYQKNPVSIDKDGTFTFEKLPNGSYYVVGQMCVEFDPNANCRPVRLGQKVRVKNQATADLDIVSLSNDEIDRLTKAREMIISKKQDEKD